MTSRKSSKKLNRSRKSSKKSIKKTSKKSSKSATRTNSSLWEKVKKKILASSKGGEPGKWSARKAQLSVSEYKKLGGGYKGPKSPSNSLTKWSKEKWDYISPKGRKSKTGRYLPEKVRKSLSTREKTTENKLKGSKRGKWIKYSPSVLKKMRKEGIIKKSRNL